MSDPAQPRESDDDNDWWNAETDRHNECQERLVASIRDTLKVFLLLGGGALAVCAGFFSAGVNLYQLHRLVLPIQLAWISLTLSIVSIAIALFLLFCYDYQFHKNRLEWLNSKGKVTKEASNWWHFFAWGFGLIGLVSFCFGMGVFCWAALGYLQAQL